MADHRGNRNGSRATAGPPSTTSVGRTRSRSNSVPSVPSVPTPPTRPRSGSIDSPAPLSGRIRASAIQPSEKITPKSFVSARAHLAASLTGANVGQLHAEVVAARAKANSWGRGSVSEARAETIKQHTIATDYTTIYRYQSDADHYKPRQQDHVSAVQQVRNLHGGRYQEGGEDALESGHVGTAILGAEHTLGANESPFVSLIEDPAKLLTSADTGKKGARTIAQKASHLYTYTVPKVFTWNTQRMHATLTEEYGDIDMQQDNRKTYDSWLTSTPRDETEVLFHGGNLNHYQTDVKRNPNLPRASGRRGRRGRRK
ncbi:MAG: hypothetical protein AAF431_04155 [Pseudomonadota bacterium]